MSKYINIEGSHFLKNTRIPLNNAFESVENDFDTLQNTDKALQTQINQISGNKLPAYYKKNVLNYANEDIIYDGVTSAVNAFSDAKNDTGLYETIYIPNLGNGIYLIDSNLSLTNRNIEIEPGARFKISNAILTIGNTIFNVNNHQYIFEYDGTGELNGYFSQEISPKWFGALGDNSTNDTNAIQAALNMVSSVGNKILFPYGIYIHNKIYIKPLTYILCDSRYNATLKFEAISNGETAIEIKAAVSGLEGNCKFENLSFTNNSWATYKDCTGIAMESGTECGFVEYLNCIFYRWNKYSLNLTRIITAIINRCVFSNICGNQGSGTVGICIYSSTGSNVLKITNNQFTFSDRVYQIQNCFNLHVDNNDTEMIGYWLNASSIYEVNPEHASYIAFKLYSVKGFYCNREYIESVRNVVFDIDETLGFNLDCLQIEGDEPGWFGGGTVTDTIFKINASRCQSLKCNYIHNYNSNWIDVTNSGTNRSSVFPNIFTNYIVNSGVFKEFPDDTSGVLSVQNIIASTLLNSWVNVGGAYQTAGYFKDNTNIVHLVGMITGGSGIMFILPEKFRPSLQQTFICNSENTTFSIIIIRSNGEVERIGGGTLEIDLSIIHFRVS